MLATEGAVVVCAANYVSAYDLHRAYILGELHLAFGRREVDLALVVELGMLGAQGE